MDLDNENQEKTSENDTMAWEERINRQASKPVPEWLKKCVSKFSLYADLIDTRAPDAIYDGDEKREFKPVLSKSGKKRLRKMRKKLAMAKQSAEMFKKKPPIAKKQTKKEMKLLTKRLSQM